MVRDNKGGRMEDFTGASDRFSCALPVRTASFHFESNQAAIVPKRLKRRKSNSSGAAEPLRVRARSTGIREKYVTMLSTQFISWEKPLNKTRPVSICIPQHNQISHSIILLDGSILWFVCTCYWYARPVPAGSGEACVGMIQIRKTIMRRERGKECGIANLMRSETKTCALLHYETRGRRLRTRKKRTSKNVIRRRTIKSEMENWNSWHFRVCPISISARGGLLSFLSLRRLSVPLGLFPGLCLGLCSVHIKWRAKLLFHPERNPAGTPECWI